MKLNHLHCAAPGTDPAALKRAVRDRLGPDSAQPLQRYFEIWSGLGVTAALPGDEAFPGRVLATEALGAVPKFLALRGVPNFDGPAVAIVGARRATSYGTGVAAWIASACGTAGVTVVSGGAVGIDAAAHEGAISAGAATTVVLGCGHDVPYPRPHAIDGGLFDRVLGASGCLVSEQLPMTPPRPPAVLARNRIVAALADVVVVVEGRHKSGSLSTAVAAAEMGRVVLAVPGDVRAPGSQAPHRLLLEGGHPCTEPRDALDALQVVAAADDRSGEHAAPTTLPRVMYVELAARWPRPIRVDELAQILKMPAGELLAAVTRGRIAGELSEAADGLRLTRSPRPEATTEPHMPQQQSMLDTSNRNPDPEVGGRTDIMIGHES